MKTLRSPKALFTALLAAGLASTANAWDQAGHLLVGQIAWTQSSPEVRRAVSETVRLLPKDYNLEREYSFAAACCWMDDMRSAPHYAWSKWHYVNIPWTADASGFVLPEGPTAISAFHQQETAWKDGSLPPLQRAEALGILMHIVGDLHQPLHACDRNGDRGGNGYLIYGVPFTDLWPGTVPNLHSFWDKAFRFAGREGAIKQLWQSPTLEERATAVGENVIAAEADRLLQRWPRSSFQAEELGGTPEQWARESYQQACLKGYPAGAPPTETEVRTLDPAFCDEANAVATRRVVQAGLRLAELLQRLFPDEAVPAGTKSAGAVGPGIPAR